MNDLDHLLPRRQAAGHFPTYRAFGDRGDKLLYHLEVDVSLKKGHADFLERLLNILFSQRPAPA